MRSVGVDLGKRKTTYCEIQEGRVVQRGTVTDARDLFEHVLAPTKGDATQSAQVLFEASRMAWWLHDKLAERGHVPIILDTTRAKQVGIGQHGRKTDRIDAEVLARALAARQYSAAHVLSPARRELRQHLNVRRMLVDTRAQHTAEARQIAYSYADTIPESHPDNFAAVAGKAKLREETLALISPLLKAIEALDPQIAAVDEKIAELSEREPVVRLLKTAPGVGPVIAATFVSVIDEARRFQTAHHVESYVGLVPSEDSTGGRRRVGSITKQGNKHLRALLIQGAWSILRGDKDDRLARWGAELAARRGNRIAVVAIARRLVGVLWAMWRDDRVYDPQRLGGRRLLPELEQTDQERDQELRVRATALARADRKGRHAQRPRRVRKATNDKTSSRVAMG